MEAYLEGLGLNHTGWLVVLSALIVLGGAVLAFIVHKAVYPLVIRITSRNPTSLSLRPCKRLDQGRPNIRHRHV